MTTTSFSNDNSRDAWFVVRGYKYQIDHTILRWLELEEGQYLALECGEDVDIVNDLMSQQSADIHRQLEQIKYRESALTLRSVACREALANAVMHRLNNPDINLLFRFCTNADVSSERPPIFDDRRKGITVWEQIRTGRRRGPAAERDLLSILSFLRNVDKPDKLAQKNWQQFLNSLSSIAALNDLIHGFEWSYSRPKSTDITAKLKQFLINSFNVSQPDVAYAWVFMGVIECLSHRSQKRLTRENLLERLSQVAERSYEQHEVRFVTEIVRELAKRVDRLEYTVQRHEHEIAVVKKSLMQLESKRVGVMIPSTVASGSIVLQRFPLPAAPTASRGPLVDSIMQVYEATTWQHLYSSAGTGKTQLANLVSARFHDAFYVSLSRLPREYTTYFLQNCLTEILLSTNYDSSESLLLVLDDLPQPLEADPHLENLVVVAEHLSEVGGNLLTLGNYKIPTHLPNAFLRQEVCPVFADEDFIDLATSTSFPPEIAANRSFLEAIKTASSQNPTLLGVLLSELKPFSGSDPDELVRIIKSQLLEPVRDKVLLKVQSTIKDSYARELLYRLCLVIGGFGAKEIQEVACVSPEISAVNDRRLQLQGPWLERRLDEEFVIGSLVRPFGRSELTAATATATLVSLANSILQGRVTPLELSKALTYIEETGNPNLFAMHIWSALINVSCLPLDAQRLIYEIAEKSRLLPQAQPVILLQVLALELNIAHSLTKDAKGILEFSRTAMKQVRGTDDWSWLFFLLSAGLEIASTDFDYALELFQQACDLSGVSIGLPEEIQSELDLDSLFAGLDHVIWHFVSAIDTTAKFDQWLSVVSKLPSSRIMRIFSTEEANEGIKLACDRLWMVQHELPERNREFEQVLEYYNRVKVLADELNLEVVSASATRAEIIVRAAYLDQLDAAVELAEQLLISQNVAVQFLAAEVIGRQLLYKDRADAAIHYLEYACQLEVQAYAGLRCRLHLELHRAIGDTNPQKSLQAAQAALQIAQNEFVSEFDLLAAYGEASIAAWHAGHGELSFNYLDSAFDYAYSIESLTDDWKARMAVLGNTLGYLANMALTGSPPASDYTIPVRGALLAPSVQAAQWYDDHAYERNRHLEATLLANFALAYGKVEFAIKWARRGIDGAREAGSLPALTALGPIVFSPLVKEGRIAEALDVIVEFSCASVASRILMLKSPEYLLTRQNAKELLESEDASIVHEVAELTLDLGILPLVAWLLANGSTTQLADLVAETLGSSIPVLNDELVRNAVGYIELFAKEDVQQLIDAILKDEEPKLNLLLNILISFTDEEELAQVLLRHVLVLFVHASRYSTSLPSYFLLVDALTEFWRKRAVGSRFLFRNPNVFEADLHDLETSPYDVRGQHLLRVTLRALGARLPSEWDAVIRWVQG